MTKSLFIYYSNTGSGEVVANYLSDKKIDIRRVTPKRELPKAFFFKIMTGGFLASIKAKSRLKDYYPDLTGYDHIIIGSPIWNDRLSSLINTVLKKTDLKDKKLTFILYSGSGNGEHAKKRINKEFPEAEIIILKEPKKYPEELEKLKGVK